MNLHRKNLVGIGTVAALALGGLAAVPSVATAGNADTGDPVFRQVPATTLLSGGESATDSATATESGAVVLARAAATVKVSKAEQVLQVFDGRQSQNAGAEPDVAVAAGPRHVVQLTNTGSLVLVKATGKAVASGFNNLRVFFDIGAPTLLRQPQIGYDPVGKRWVASALTDTGGDIGVVLRVSKGTKPTNWFRAVAYLDSGSDEAGREDVVESLPRLGISGDKVVLTMAADDPNDAIVANRILVVNKSALYGGGPAPEAWVADVNSSYDGSVPAVNASKGANAFVAVPDNDGGINDFTVYTLSGPATDNAPNFSKSVMFPSWTLTPPPTIPASADGGDALAVNDSLSSAAWRKGNLWVATTVTCTPSGDTGPRACLRMIRVNTKNGVFLAESRLSSRIGTDWFAPAIAIDGNNAPHVGFTYANAAASGGPGFAVMVRKAKKKWPFRVVAKPQAPIDGPGSPTPWSRFAGAASDPTSPWDVWVSGAFGSETAENPNWGTSIARVSRGINTASVKPNKKRVSKGTRVTFKGSLLRPASTNAVQGLPVTLQARPAGTKKWRNVGSGTVNAQGVKTWKLRVSTTTQYRLVGRPVNQVGGEGQLVAKAIGSPVRVRVR